MNGAGLSREIAGFSKIFSLDYQLYIFHNNLTSSKLNSVTYFLDSNQGIIYL